MTDRSFACTGCISGNCPVHTPPPHPIEPFPIPGGKAKLPEATPVPFTRSTASPTAETKHERPRSEPPQVAVPKYMIEQMQTQLHQTGTRLEMLVSAVDSTSRAVAESRDDIAAIKGELAELRGLHEHMHKMLSELAARLLQP